MTSPTGSFAGRLSGIVVVGHLGVLVASSLGCGARTNAQASAPVARPVPQPASPAPGAAAVAPPRAEPIDKPSNDKSLAEAQPAQAKTELPAMVSVSKAHADGNHWSIDVKAPALVTIGGEAEVELVLSGKDGYRIDPKFAYGITPRAEPVGLVTFKDRSIARSGGTFTKSDARFKASFAGAKAGAVGVGAIVALSVCKAKDCVTENIAIDVPVTVR